MAFNPQGTSRPFHSDSSHNNQHHGRPVSASTSLSSEKEPILASSDVSLANDSTPAVQEVEVRPKKSLSLEARINRVESVAWYVLLVTIFLVPLAFVSSSYISPNIGKVAVIVV